MGLFRLEQANSFVAKRSPQGIPHNAGINTKGQAKVKTVMKEFKKGSLHSGKSKKIVKNKKQAIAIALSEAGLSKKK